MGRKASLRVALAFVLLAFASGAHAQPAGPLRGELDRIVREADLGDGISFAVSALSDSREIWATRGDALRNPASNMKLVTAAAALTELGPGFQMRTGVYGRVDNGRVADLVIRGYGDPSLSQGDLYGLASALVDRGIRAVDRIWVDGSYFDDQILPPAFEQQPNETAAFRAPIGAVVVDRGSFVLRVIPGETGSAAVPVLAGAGYFAVDNEMTTTADGAPNVIASQRDTDDGRLALILRGSVPANILGVGYRRRVGNPLLHAGYVFQDVLEDVGIGGRRGVALGSGPSGLPLLADTESETLAQLLHRVGKWSDNFYAEMILKVMGAEERRPGTSERGAAINVRTLGAAGADTERLTIVNGSGLFDGNQISTRHFTKLLHWVYQQPGIRAEYLSHLAIGGVDGTLRRRLQNVPPGVVRAKTGTLNDAIALSGYVLGEEPGRGYAFSFLANGIRGRQGAARRLADQLVTALVERR